MGFEPIGFVLERVYDLLKHEASILLVDEKTEIEGMKWELEEIESFLKDMDEVERLATINHGLRTKVQHLRQILPQIEDLLDKVTDEKREIEQIQRPSFIEKLKVFCSCASNPLIQKHRLVGEIRGIRAKLSDIRRPEGYPLPSNCSQVIYRTRHQTDPGIIDHEIIIGLDEDVADLVAEFVGREGGRGANSAIVGMGGSGKTTLAKRFYNHKEISKAFPRRAWVCVSQQWDTKELLLQICAMLGVGLSEDEKSIARHKLTEFLRKEGSCLVVLDDVWERQALQDFLPTLLTGNGRVLVTTRKERIFQFPGIAHFHVHNMRRLTPEQSRELFSNIVCNNMPDIVKFGEEETEVEAEDEFAKLGREMLDKCGGLPIAIITLAGLLGTKATIQDWKNIKDNVISIIMKAENYDPIGYETVKKVLEFSYFDLPYYLKPCFLYLGIYKEDKEIDAPELINLWIDEGFVKPDQCPERTRLEEVAKSFLEELVQRCIVQVVRRDYTRDVISIRIHDLIRDLCIDKAKEMGFFRVFSPSTTSSTQIEQCPRVVVQNISAESLVLDNSRLRTFICEAEYGTRFSRQLVGFEKLKQVRVLSLDIVELGDSAEHIGNMVLLRYLRLMYCRFTKMDFSKKLRNLQTFIFYHTEEGSVELCDDMVGSMEQLRVLHFEYIPNSGGSSSISISNSMGMDKLRNLQSLNLYSSEWIVKELPAAICSDLQQLFIWKIQSQPQLDAILCCLNNNIFTCLQTLDLSLESESLEFDMQKMNLERHCQQLKSLTLSGKVKKQRAGSLWSLPPNLLSLNLQRTEVEEEGDMNQFIAQLPHLRELSLISNEYKGANLTMTGLPNLHSLDLYDLQNLKEWSITKGSLPQLRELSIIGCRELESIPDGITHLKTLQLLDVRVMTERFCKRLKKREEGESEGGEDFHLVQHIPTLRV